MKNIDEALLDSRRAWDEPNELWLAIHVPTLRIDSPDRDQLTDDLPKYLLAIASNPSM